MNTKLKRNLKIKKFKRNKNKKMINFNLKTNGKMIKLKPNIS